MRKMPLLLVSTLLLGAGPALSAEVRFTGETTANGRLISDALRTAMFVARARTGCENPDLVEALILSTEGEPSEVAKSGGAIFSIHEEWTITICGERLPFGVEFWDAPQGGVMFSITEQSSEPAPAP